jgi:hypothetical protein
MPETIKCDTCGREQAAKPAKKGDVKLPPGWKRWSDQVYCRDCWSDAFVLRAITLPVHSVVEGGEWADFFAAVRQSWQGATDVSNWAVTELAKADIPRTADQERMAVFKPPYLYPGARKVAPDLVPTSIVAVLHAVEGRYRKARLQTIWFRQASHPVYRYPVPLPIHNQSWECVLGEGGRACISMRIGDRRWTVSLATARHKRQLSAWRKILSGGAIAGELAILGREARASDHRQNGRERNRGGGRKRSIRVMAKLVAWFPKRASREREGVLYLSTSSDAFWTYRVGTDGEPKYLRAAHLRRWEKQHRRHLEALADDLKYEKRWPSDVRQQANERQDLWVRKYRDRIDSFCHEATAMLAGVADRSNVLTVVYDDKNQSYVDRFPWHRLVEQLRYKLDERHIALEVIAKSDTKGGDEEELAAAAAPTD